MRNLNLNLSSSDFSLDDTSGLFEDFIIKLKKKVEKISPYLAPIKPYEIDFIYIDKLTESFETKKRKENIENKNLEDIDNNIKNLIIDAKVLVLIILGQIPKNSTINKSFIENIKKEFDYNGAKKLNPSVLSDLWEKFEFFKKAEEVYDKNKFKNSALIEVIINNSIIIIELNRTKMDFKECLKNALSERISYF